MAGPLEWTGHTLRALAAIKDCWDENRDFEGWDEFAEEFNDKARIRVLIQVALMIADRGDMKAIDLEAWGDELIAEGRRRG